MTEIWHRLHSKTVLKNFIVEGRGHGSLFVTFPKACKNVFEEIINPEQAKNVDGNQHRKKIKEEENSRIRSKGNLHAK